jgi:hypothetical protein
VLIRHAARYNLCRSACRFHTHMRVIENKNIRADLTRMRVESSSLEIIEKSLTLF